MSEIPFPPNLRQGRASGHLERVHVCPQCGVVLFLNYYVEEVIHGRSNGWRDAQKCLDWACSLCRHEFKLMTPRSNCAVCSTRADCLLHGTSEVITRRVFKPYSTIKPRRATIWE